MPKQIPIATIVNNIGVEGVLTIKSSAETHIEITQPYAGVKRFIEYRFFLAYLIMPIFLTLMLLVLHIEASVQLGADCRLDPQGNWL